MREEEVAVLLVVGHVDLEGCGLRAALGGDALRRRLLLRQDRLQLQLAELPVGAQAEERCSAVDKRVVRGERDVAGLDELDDLVLLALIFQLEVLCVEVEGGVGVVVEVHVHLVAHLTVDREVDLLVEVEGRRLAVADGQRGVVDVLQRGTHLQLGRALCLHADAARAEDFLGRAEVEVHVGEVELVLALRLDVLGVLLAEELLAGAPLAPLHVFLGRHHDGRVQIGVADLRSDIIESERVVVLHLLLDILRHVQVERARVEVLDQHGRRRLDAPAGVEQRVGDDVVVGHGEGLRLGLGGRTLDLGGVRRLGLTLRRRAAAGQCGPLAGPSRIDLRHRGERHDGYEHE